MVGYNLPIATISFIAYRLVISKLVNNILPDFKSDQNFIFILERAQITALFFLYLTPNSISNHIFILPKVVLPCLLLIFLSGIFWSQYCRLRFAFNIQIKKSNSKLCFALQLGDNTTLQLSVSPLGFTVKYKILDFGFSLCIGYFFIAGNAGYI